nr:histone deacetylase 14 [Tanacetum cinerariifolium]
EHVLGYLKFSAKGTKREVFGMPIPGSLIIAKIQEASYYREYLAKVAQHQRYLAGEIGSNPVSPAPKPTKPARKPKSTVPKAPPRPAVAAKDTDFQKALEESMKTAYALPRGPLPPVVAHDLLSLQKHKKTSPADQYIFQRRIFEPIGSSEHDESPYALLRQSDSDEELEKVVLGADEGGQDEGQAGPDPGAQAEDQTGSDAGAQDEGQAGLNPDETSKGQAGPDPGNAGAKVQSIPRHVVHVVSDHEHMDLDVADVSPQPSMEQLDEGFTATAYLKVQENLKLAVEEQVLLEDPASLSGTLSSLQHLSKDISFGDLFFSDRPSDADKNAETEVESMVHQQFKATTTDTTTTTTTLPPPQAQQQSTTEVMMMKRIDELEHIMANLIQVNKDIEERHRPSGEPSYLEKLINRDHSEELAKDLAEARKKKKKSRESPKTPPGSPPHHPPPPPPPVGPSRASGAPGVFGSSQVPPPPPPPSSTNQESSSKGSAAPSSSKTTASAEYQAWMTTDFSDDEDIRSAHILTVNLRQDLWKPFEEERHATPEPAWSIRSSDVPVPMNNWASALASNYSPPPEDSLLAQTDDIATFMDWFCKRRGITELKPQDLEGPAYEIVKVFHPDVIHLLYQMEECHKLLTDSVDDPILRHNVSKPLPLGGPPGQVIIQSDFFFNKDLEYLRYGSKGRRPVLSISKIKAAYFPDAGLEKMVPDHAVRTHMRILSVVRIEVFSMYGYDYMKKIVLQDFQLGIESYQTHINLTKPQWDATGFEYNHDNTVIDSPMAVIFWDKYEIQVMMRFNEIHKFSDGTLHQIDEALDYRVNEFRINRMNLGLNTRFWTRKDVDWCKAFMFAIQRHLRTKRIFCNLRSFVGGRVREGDYRLLKRTE